MYKIAEVKKICHVVVESTHNGFDIALLIKRADFLFCNIIRWPLYVHATYP